MKLTPLQALVGQSPTDTENAFYQALQTANIHQLMSCWSDDSDILCVQPGGARLLGSVAIRAVFEGLFQTGCVRVHPERVRKIQSTDSSVHHLIERVELLTPKGVKQAYVVVTNVYHQTPEGWLMVVHHASPGTVLDRADVGTQPLVLH